MSASTRGATDAMGVDRGRVPEPGPLRPFHFPRIESLHLGNGIPVLYAQSPGFGVATVSVVLEAGALNEPASRAGLATLTSSLLESGAGSRSAPQIAEEIERLGVELGVGTTWEISRLDLNGLISRLPSAMSVLADLVRAPTFPGEEVERLRHEQLAGILQRRADPRGLANEMASRFIFSEDSPFARPLGGTTTSVQRLTRDEVVDFHANHYTPSAAGLVIAGDLSPEEAAALAERQLADWAGPRSPAIEAPVKPRYHTPHIVLIDRPGSVQSELRAGHVGVARDTPDYFALAVTNALLGGAFSSRLNLNLRERHGFTYGVNSTFVMRRRPGPFLVSTAVQTEVTAQALAEIVKELRELRENPVREREIEDARTYLAGTFPLPLQTTAGVASRLAELLVHRLPLDYFDDYRDRVLAVSVEDVLRAAREHIHPDHLVAVVVGDAATVRGPLEELGWGPVVQVDAAEEE